MLVLIVVDFQILNLIKENCRETKFGSPSSMQVDPNLLSHSLMYMIAQNNS